MIESDLRSLRQELEMHFKDSSFKGGWMLGLSYLYMRSWHVARH